MKERDHGRPAAAGWGREVECGHDLEVAAPEQRRDTLEEPRCSGGSKEMEQLHCQRRAREETQWGRGSLGGG
jgi:hypothetical protein